ncbi:MAG: AI-2E family transporter [Planctomycetota bacterium]
MLRGVRNHPGNAIADIEETKQRTTWRTGDLLRAAGVFVAVYVLVQLLWAAHVILFLAFLGLLFGLAMASAVDPLERWGLPRGLGTAAVVLVLFSGSFLIGAIMAPTVRAQTVQLRRQLPEALDRLESWAEDQEGVLEAMLPFAGGEEPDTTDAKGASVGKAPPDMEQPDDVEEPARTVRDEILEQLGGLGRRLFSFLTSTLTVAGSVLFILFIAIYYAVEPKTYRRGALLLVPCSGRRRAAAVMRETGLVLRRWLVTQLITMVTIGVVSTITLLLLDVRAAVALGIIAALLEFIPIFGPILAAVPAIAMGFLESPLTALYVTLAYVVIQQLESHLLVPLLMKEGVYLPPILTVMSQALMALVFGFVGLLVAVPLLAAALVLIKMLYVQEVVGNDVLLPTDGNGGG